MLIEIKSAVLIVADKFKILEHLKNGVGGYGFAQVYSVGTYMISDIK